MIDIELSNRQSALEIDADRLKSAARAIVQDERIARAQVSLAVVDDATIHALNRRYLNHDYPTDVLSFVFDRQGDRLDGEVVVSAETAAAAAGQYDWSPAAELLLYVIHGMLHLVGYDDQTPKALSEMRRRERHYLAGFDLQPR